MSIRWCLLDALQCLPSSLVDGQLLIVLLFLFLAFIRYVLCRGGAIVLFLEFFVFL